MFNPAEIMKIGSTVQSFINESKEKIEDLSARVNAVAVNQVKLNERFALIEAKLDTIIENMEKKDV